MKILEIYDKDSDLRCYKRNVFEVIEDYMKRFPEEYSNCYHENLSFLELYKVDKMDDRKRTGIYDTDANAIAFSQNNALPHELFHMASNDMVNNKYAIESKLGIEDGLIEGITEYLAMNACGLKNPTKFLFNASNKVLIFLKPYLKL